MVTSTSSAALRSISVPSSCATCSSVPCTCPRSASAQKPRSRSDIPSPAAAGRNGGNTPCVREYASARASGTSSRRAASAVPATATVP
ncbi:hypothetical protein ACFVT2_06580 [Streptomyces sp. NPDC058000]|uniref:hypothetical protein n=1 Tax=Streptomyces sp. NPDC058000 TaxID=3346299 RepID=UPI0036EFF1A4